MLTWLAWGVGSITAVNAVALIALIAAYAWHHGLKPVRDGRRVRRRTFEQLLAQPIPVGCTVPWSSTESSSARDPGQVVAGVLGEMPSAPA